MSTRYESVHNALIYPDVFHVAAPPPPVGLEVWPRKPGVFIRVVAGVYAIEATEVADEIAAVDSAQADKPARELVHELAAGQFGFVPRWVKSASDAKLRSTKLVNARSETVTTSNNFRDSWLAG